MKNHVKNSSEFTRTIKDKRVEEDEEMRSCDVTALFTSVPVEKAISVIRQRLMNDESLPDRTSLSPDDIAALLTLCLKCTYFTFRGHFYLQIHCAPMGSPVSPIVCNIYMEEFENHALATHDDTHTKQKVEHTESFSQHLNSLDQDIKFNSEGEENDALAFLDTLTCKQADGSVKVKVFRKATHTDQYPKFQSYQPLQHKLAVVRTLCHRANIIISTEEYKEEENRHITSKLRECGYPKWAIDQALKPKKPSCRRIEPASGLSPQSVPNPYIKGVAEKTQRIFKSTGVKRLKKSSPDLKIPFLPKMRVA